MPWLAVCTATCRKRTSLISFKGAQVPRSIILTGVWWYMACLLNTVHIDFLFFVRVLKKIQ